MNQEILIVGAGPTGLALASVLQRYGLDFRIIDAGPGPSKESRALAVQPRTLELLDRQITNALLSKGQKITAAEIFDGEEKLARIDLSEAPTPYPFALALSQSETERVFIEHLAKREVDVFWDTKLTDLSQTPTAVKTKMLGPRGETTGFFQWVVGCDGVRSTTRELAGLEVEAVGDPRWWILADAKLSGNTPDHDSMCVYVGARGPFAYIPLEQKEWWRIILVGDEGEEKPEVTQALIEETIAQRSPKPATVDETSWLSAFQIREHVARHYRKGRVFIAGDAAHAHSPLGGQGMNTGIQDAVNLGWKLAMVCQGARPTLLDTYEEERRPVGETLVKTTHRGTRAMYVSAPWLVWLRNQAVHNATKLEAVNDRIVEGVEMLNIAYPKSSIVHEVGIVSDDRQLELPDKEAKLAIRSVAGPGERAPVDVSIVRDLVEREKHTVLLFDGQDDSEGGYQRMCDLGKMLKDSNWFYTVAVIEADRLEKSNWKLESFDEDAFDEVLADDHWTAHDAFGAKSETLVVIRPDGYIGFRSQPIDAEHLADWCHQLTGTFV